MCTEWSLLLDCGVFLHTNSAIFWRITWEQKKKSKNVETFPYTVYRNNLQSLIVVEMQLFNIKYKISVFCHKRLWNFHGFFGDFSHAFFYVLCIEFLKTFFFCLFKFLKNENEVNLSLLNKISVLIIKEFFLIHTDTNQSIKANSFDFCLWNNLTLKKSRLASKFLFYIMKFVVLL